MKLSDYDGTYFKTLRDGSFEVLGLAQKKMPKPSLGYAGNEKFLKAACRNETISCIICPSDLSGDTQLIESGKGIAVCEMPKEAFFLLHNHLVQNDGNYLPQYTNTFIGHDCKIHPTASIAPLGVTIGRNVTIEEFVIIKEGCRIDDNAIIRAGAILGAENCDLCWNKEGRIIRMKETGWVHIEANADIGCHAIIGRAPFPYETTVIGEGSCIDSAAMIPHACRIGRNCYISVNAALGGSVTVKDGARIDPMATIGHSLTIGKNAVVSLGSVVAKNVREGSRVTGNFAIEHSQFLADCLKKLRNR